MSSGYITLAEIASRLTTLDVACNRCDRRGHVSVARLLAERGADFPAPNLRRILAADCPRMIAAEVHDPCGVHFPDLPARF
jgi:hypothetical protein